MKYIKENLGIGQLYKCWFREQDYWVIEYTPAIARSFHGNGVFFGDGKRKIGVAGLGVFPDSWKFSDPSPLDIEEFYQYYPESKKEIKYEIY